MAQKMAGLEYELNELKKRVDQEVIEGDLLAEKKSLFSTSRIVLFNFPST